MKICPDLPTRDTRVLERARKHSKRIASNKKILVLGLEESDGTMKRPCENECEVTSPTGHLLVRFTAQGHIKSSHIISHHNICDHTISTRLIYTFSTPCFNPIRQPNFSTQLFDLTFQPNFSTQFSAWLSAPNPTVQFSFQCFIRCF